MTISQIKWFLTVARTLNFTKAADQLGVSQPTLSRQILNMEEELNLQLFIRHGRSITLTPAGRSLEEQWADVYEQYQGAVSTAQQIQKGINGDLRIGILDGTYVSDFMPLIISFFEQQHPYVEIMFENCSFEDLENKLYSSALDIAFTVHFSVAQKDYLIRKHVEHSRDYLMMNRYHHLASKDRVTLADCRDEVFILISREDCLESSELIIDACKERGFYPNIKYAPSLYDMMLSTETGKGITILDSRNMLRFNPYIKAYEMEKMKWDPSLVAAWNRSNYNPAIPIFMKQLDRVIKELEKKKGKEKGVFANAPWQ
ncbi:MAG: LysR family transcriptional regulator [Eubacterium sp.]|nr:LysR family transcriptional regulator [Eubacterium sp.]